MRVSVLLPVGFLALAAAAGGCGKKAPPLAPLRIVPAPVADLTARRLGGEVHLRFTIPSKNQDNTTPADVQKVEVYGFTGKPVDKVGRPLDDRQLLKKAMLVGTIEVQPPPPPPSEEEPGAAPKSEAPPAPPSVPAAPEAPDPRPKQGDIVTLVEELTPDRVAPVVTEEKKEGAPPGVPVTEPESFFGPVTPPPTEAPVTRIYLAVGVSQKGHDGPASGRVQVPLVAPPPAPGAPCLAYSETAIIVEWAPPEGARRRIQQRTTTSALSAKPFFPSLAHTYNVYEVPPTGTEVPAPVVPGGKEGQPVLDLRKPLNESPLETVTYQDSRLEFGVARCYVIRTVEGAAAQQVESEPSPAVCVTPQDTFPPVAPKGLAAVASEGAISLIWDPSSEKDLAGYMVLRAEAPGETLQPLTPTPIRETTYRDANVRPGVRYVYAIVAVDSATPPNMSQPSARVEESAR